MISKGLSDLKVKIGSERVESMKCILMNGNETFRKLLEDVEIGEELVLCEGSSVDGFIEIEKYYSGGSMELNDENVMKVLLMSINYNDKEILRICIKYIRNHLNDEMMLRIMELSDLLKKEDIFELIKMSEEYLKENGYKYLNDDRLLYKLRIENLRLILENENLIIKDDTWLLKVLMKWYKNEKGSIENEEEQKELREELKRLIIKSIYIDKLRLNEIDNDEMDELKNIEIIDYLEEMKNRKKYKCLNDFSIEDERILESILKYYKTEEADKINVEDLNELKNESVISKLLKSKDIKMKEIGILIITDSGIEYKSVNKMLNKRKRREILRELIREYKTEKKNNRIIKCMCLFVNDKEYLKTLVSICGKEILYRIINNDYYYSKESKDLLIKYIDEMWKKVEDDEENQKEMLNIIENEEMRKVLKTKEIASFSYPQSDYSFQINEEISIIPSFDGTQCEFSINPLLPSGLEINKENGIIHGKVDKKIENREYEIICKNVKNEKKFKILLELLIAKLTELNKNQYITISNNGKVITKINNNNIYSHCYLNLKMDNGIYHIKYQYHRNQSDGDNTIIFGLSTDNTFSDDNNCFSQSTTCNYRAWSGESRDITPCCYIGKVVNSNPNFKNHGDGSIYEVIVDMNKREFWISHNNSSPVLLVKDLPSPLYPYAVLQRKYTSFELLSVSHQN